MQKWLFNPMGNRGSMWRQHATHRTQMYFPFALHLGLAHLSAKRTFGRPYWLAEIMVSFRNLLWLAQQSAENKARCYGFAFANQSVSRTSDQNFRRTRLPAKRTVKTPLYYQR